jgi:hypothetical protein
MVVPGSVVVVVASVVVVVASVVVVVAAVVVVDGAVVVVVVVVVVVAGLVVVVTEGARVVVVVGPVVEGLEDGCVVGGLPGSVGVVGSVGYGPGVPLRGGRPAGAPGVVVVEAEGWPAVSTVAETVVVVIRAGAVVPGAARISGSSTGRHDFTGSRSGSTRFPTAAASTYTTFPGPRPSRSARYWPSSVTPTTWTVSPRMRRLVGGSPGQAVIGAAATTTPAVS